MFLVINQHGHLASTLPCTLNIKIDYCAVIEIPSLCEWMAHTLAELVEPSYLLGKC